MWSERGTDHAYNQVIVVAGSNRKLMCLPAENQFVITDFIDSMTSKPEYDNGLQDA